MNFKGSLSVFVVGAVGGLIAAIFVTPILARVNFFGTASISSVIKSPDLTPRIEEKNISVPDPVHFTNAINKIGPSMVAIQSFNSGQLIRYGSGMILTQDGLVATLSSVVPSSANFFQVIQDGKIYKAKVVFRDYSKNIAIMSIPETGSSVVGLNPDPPALGQDLLIISKTVDLNKDSLLVNKALVSEVSENGFKISTPYSQDFYGAALTDDRGQIFGVVDFQNQNPLLVSSKIITNVLNSYLAK